MPTQRIRRKPAKQRGVLDLNWILAISILFLLIAFMVCIWLGWAIWVIGHFEKVIDQGGVEDKKSKVAQILEIAGPYGDLFGGINALFTGLGLAFLIYTVLQQSKMIRQQSEDLQNQRDATERSQALQSMLQIRAVLQDEETRKAREIVLSGVGKPTDMRLLTRVLLKKSLQGTRLFTLQEMGLGHWYLAPERVLHTYDYVGVLDGCGHFHEQDFEIIGKTWGESIQRCHEELKDFLTVPFRPKEITENDIDAIDNMDTLEKRFPRPRSHGLPYNNFVLLVKELKEKGE